MPQLSYTHSLFDSFSFFVVVWHTDTNYKNWNRTGKHYQKTESGNRRGKNVECVGNIVNMLGKCQTMLDYM